MEGEVMKLRLKELREARFMTQRELAARAGVGLVTIVRLEKDRQEPTFQTIKRLAAALEVDPNDLVIRELSENRTA